MADELLDLVDKDDKVIGTVWKSEALGNPKMLHRAIALAVFNDKNQVLLHQRSLTMSSAPGIWRSTVSGHVHANEDPKFAAERELHEELGLNVDAKFYKKIVKRFMTERNIKIPRFFWIFYAFVSSESKLILDKGEVENAEWVNIDDLKKFAENHDYNLKDFSQLLIMDIIKFLNLK